MRNGWTANAALFSDDFSERINCIVFHLEWEEDRAIYEDCSLHFLMVSTLAGVSE